VSATKADSIEAIFAAGGPLALALDDFEARPGQVQMSQLIERGFLEGTHTLVEAGTGVGKSLAYLIPALRSGKKVVISTATIALQEQLVRKDIPLVLRALDIPARVELLKGRSHYLCRQKLDRMRADRLVAQSGTMERMWSWADRTESGDRAELDFAPPSGEWELLDADADDCVGEFCERFKDCWFFTRRDAAKFADVVVVNHALFFLDLALGGTLLPPYDFAILDEAHQCERWASAALTATLSRTSSSTSWSTSTRPSTRRCGSTSAWTEFPSRRARASSSRSRTTCTRSSTGSAMKGSSSKADPARG